MALKVSRRLSCVSWFFQRNSNKVMHHPPPPHHHPRAADLPTTTDEPDNERRMKLSLGWRALLNRGKDYATSAWWRVNATQSGLWLGLLSLDSQALDTPTLRLENALPAQPLGLDRSHCQYGDPMRVVALLRPGADGDPCSRFIATVSPAPRIGHCSGKLYRAIRDDRPYSVGLMAAGRRFR